MSGAEPVRLRPPRRCLVCGKPPLQKYFPFCSARCANVDLNRWLGGRYAIPAQETGDEQEQREDTAGPRRSGDDKPT